LKKNEKQKSDKKLTEEEIEKILEEYDWIIGGSY